LPPNSFQVTPTYTASGPRVLYPLSRYMYGNPGYYYDPLQFPMLVGLQTEPWVSNIQPPPISGSNMLPFQHVSLCHCPNQPTSYTPVASHSHHLMNVVTSTSSSTYPMVSPDNDHHVNFQSSVETPFSDIDDVEQNIPHVSGDVSFAPVTPSSTSRSGILDHPYHHQHHVGCQVSTPIDKYIVKDLKNLNLLFYDPSKIAWHTFSINLHAALIDCNMEYLLTSNDTNPSNAKHSKELMVELYKKLQGGAIDLFCPSMLNTTTLVAFRVLR